jgi:hypothetical protein
MEKLPELIIKKVSLFGIKIFPTFMRLKFVFPEYLFEILIICESSLNDIKSYYFLIFHWENMTNN